jgi:hypothetical protein
MIHIRILTYSFFILPIELLRCPRVGHNLPKSSTPHEWLTLPGLDNDSVAEITDFLFVKIGQAFRKFS